jgi:hypothetical protein
MKYIEITANGTTYVKNGPGYLQGILVNNATGTSPTIQILDINATASTSPAIAGGSAAFAVPAAGTFLDYDCNFSNGLAVIVGGTFSGSLTVTYY